MADVDAAFEQEVLDLTQRQWMADVHHHFEPDDFGRGFEIPEGIGLHLRRLKMRALQLKRVFSDRPTHAIGGPSENDFICAARVNTLI